MPVRRSKYPLLLSCLTFDFESEFSCSAPSTLRVLVLKRRCSLLERVGLLKEHPLLTLEPDLIKAVVTIVTDNVSRFGLAVRQRDLGSNPLRLSFLFESCGLCTLSCDFVPYNYETLKWLSSLPTLMQKSFRW